MTKVVTHEESLTVRLRRKSRNLESRNGNLTRRARRRGVGTGTENGNAGEAWDRAAMWIDYPPSLKLRRAGEDEDEDEDEEGDIEICMTCYGTSDFEGVGSIGLGVKLD